MKVTVTIENHRDTLRLRWKDSGVRHSLSLGIPNNPIGRALAEQKKVEIEIDYLNNTFDSTLVKYRPELVGKDPTIISVPELFEAFTKHQVRQKSLAESSVKSRYNPITVALRKYLDVPITSVGPMAVEKFSRTHLSSLQPNTAKARVWLLQSCWKWAQNHYKVLDPNPWTALLPRFKPMPTRKVEPFSLEEVNKIITGFKSNKYYSHYSDFVTFLFGVGCRFGEAVAIRWEHVNVDSGTVWIGQSISKGKLGLTKTKKSRVVTLSPSIKEMLRQRKEDITPPPLPSDLIFPTPTGLPINDHNFRRRAWKAILEEVGVPYRKPYSTRHTAVSHALANGANYVALANATGHDPYVMHKHYANIIDKKSVLYDFEQQNSTSNIKIDLL